jgi:hypothetical protein
VSSSLELWIKVSHTGDMTSKILTVPFQGPVARRLAQVAADVRGELRELREVSAARRQLRRELAAYDTPSAIEDLLVAVDRSADDPAAGDIRAILHDNYVRYHTQQRQAFAS